MLLFRRLSSLSFLRPICRRTFTQQDKGTPINDEQMQREREIAFRKRLMEEKQVKAIRESIETTKGDYSPIIQYLKLFKLQLLYLALFGCFATAVFVIAKVSGVHHDTITKKKKFILISDEFEKGLEKNLRQTFTTHFGFGEKPSSTLQKGCKELEAFLKQRTGRDYKMVAVQAESQTMIVLPGSIVVSKSLLLSTNKTDLQRTLLLMEALFTKKLHIQQLAYSNFLSFLTHWIKPSNVSDITMLKIYSRQYKKNEIEESIHYVANKYGISVEDIKGSVVEIVKNGKNDSTTYSLGKRLKQINQ